MGSGVFGYFWRTKVPPRRVPLTLEIVGSTRNNKRVGIASRRVIAPYKRCGALYQRGWALGRQKQAHAPKRKKYIVCTIVRIAI